MPNKELSPKKRVVIVGGGFGGIEVFKKLQAIGKNQFDITLINNRTDFIFTPLLHEAATGGVELSNIAAPIRSFISTPDAHFVCTTITEMDEINKVVKNGHCTFSYDYLVLATGSVSNTRETKGAKELCHFLKTVEDAVALRKKILDSLEQYALYKDPTFVKFTVIGGGSTGVELALEIEDFVCHTLSKYYQVKSLKADCEIVVVCPSEKVVMNMHHKIQSIAMKRLTQANIKLKMKTSVVEVAPDGVYTDTGEKILSSVNIWCGGVFPVMPSFTSGIKAIPTKALNLTDWPEIFVLGDCLNYGTDVPMDAQAAVKQAHVVAYNIKALHSGRPVSDFEYKQSGSLISLGRWHAAGKIGPFVFSGPFAWWVWRTIYLLKFPLASKRFKIALDWTVAVFSGRDISNV